MDTVILMAKAPVPGAVKTRLCPPLTPAGAARLYDRLLRDTASRIRSVDRVRRMAFHDPPGASDFFRSAPFRGFEARPQRGADLGERMSRAAAEAFAEGAGRVAIVGADCPDMTASRIAMAFRELRDGADAAFGPATDGGFYLAAFREPPGALFGRGIAWGTGTVMAAVAARCRLRGMAWSLLPEARDVDTPEDLAWLLEREGKGVGISAGEAST
jgi:rSAM/selenodomain-associated transferase 1